ncbi:MAG: ester cyclase [Acidobacteria bacterium]|nr:ester cyclase [Acidobacteriota bacterium]
MLEENKALVQRWFEEVWNQGRAEAIDEMLAADAVVHGLADESGQPLRGTADFRPFHRKFREAFPDIYVVVEDAIAEGDRVAVRCSVRGSHRGDSLGFAASHREAAFTGIALVRISDGKIVEAWNNFDFMSMYRQLGAI